MRYVLAKDLKPGMTLAQKLVDPNGRVLAGENSKLSEYAIEKLVRDGYDGVYIVDALSADIVIEGPIRNDLRVAGMSCVQMQDVDACKGGVRSEHPHLSLMGPETSDTHVLQSLDCGVVC